MCARYLKMQIQKTERVKTNKLNNN
jgi:hypothetical protein